MTMHQYDIWIDLECTVGGMQTTICTLFGKTELPVRPYRGELITFWPAKNTSVSFNIHGVAGVQAFHCVSIEIHDLAHHLRPGEGAASVSTCIHGWPIHVASVSDARRVVEFLCEQHGFEVDPYGINRLAEDDNAA